MTLLMVMLTVIFTACSDDDEEQQDDKTLALLVGSWENELDSFTDVNGNVVSSTTEVLTFKAVTMRSFQILPDAFISVFYTGLSLALIFTGVLFIRYWWINRKGNLFTPPPEE